MFGGAIRCNRGFVNDSLFAQFAELRQLQGGMVVFGFCLLPRMFLLWLDITLKSILNAKDSDHKPSIKWSIADRATAYQPESDPAIYA